MVRFFPQKIDWSLVRPGLFWFKILLATNVLAQTTTTTPISPPSPAQVPNPAPQGAGAQGSSPFATELANAQKLVVDGIGAFPKKILILEEMGEDGPPVLASLNLSENSPQGYFEVAHSKDLEWELKLNYRQNKKAKGHQLATDLSGADTIVHAPPSGNWSIYRIAKKGSLDKVANRTGPSQRSPKTIVAWIFETLGWDGVVLAQRGESLIVGSSSEILSHDGLQALSVNHSHGKWALPEAERKGSGIMSLVKRDGAFALFDIVFVGSGVNTIPVGTKLIIEKKK